MLLIRTDPCISGRAGELSLAHQTFRLQMILWKNHVVPFEIVEIGDLEVNQVLQTEESHTSDLKAMDVAPAKLTRSLAAFCNAEGGELFVGVDEDRVSNTRAWRGFASIEAANGHVQAFEEFFPLGQFADYQFLRQRENPDVGLVLKITLQRTPDVRRATDGKAYVRRGASNLPVVDLEGIRRLEYAKGVRSFETHPIDIPLDFITNSLTIIGFMLEVVPTGEPLPWLSKQLLIRDDKPTVASVLLFADEPQAALPKQSAIKIYRYATTDDVGSRVNLVGQPLTIEGPIYDVIRDAVRTTVDLVQGIRVLTPNGFEDISYPHVTLHEIVTNAALHRDYSIADDIHIRVFDNRVEVESPGGLPAHLTPENIYEERFGRNGQLIRWVNKFPNPPNKDVGEGLRTASEAMKSLKLKPPEIIDKRTSVLVLIRHQRLASPEEVIIEYLQTHPEISNSVVRKLTGIGSENTVKRIFQRMIRVGELESIPNRPLRDAAYRLPQSVAAEGEIAN
jgi:ATP-dependent DNA helicase RecG